MTKKVEVLALDKKYRPRNFDEMVGNAALVASARSILQRETGIPSAFLLTGPSGCGKTTLARIIANELGGTEATVKEYNISNMTGVDTARAIIEHTQFLPFGGKKKIYILNECHRASKNFQDAMLETIEEPPSYVHFILCTTDPQALLKTIVTRCVKLQVSPLRTPETISLLKFVCQEENVEDIGAELLTKIAQCCDGSPRTALVMLDSVIDCEPDKRMDAILKHSAETTTTINICQALLERKAWTEMAEILGTLENEPESARMGVLTYMDKVLLSVAKGKKPGERQMRAWEIIAIMGENRIYHKAQLTAKCFELLSPITTA